MLYRSEPLRLVVWGELGVFTKPEFRTDRVTHLIIPPTAALGIVSSIFLHPEADIHNGESPRLGIEVSEIRVLNPIKTTTFRVNEIGKLPTKTGSCSLDSTHPNNVMQTSVCAVKDPKYLIEFTYVSNDSWQMAKKGAEIFKRRLTKGQCFRQPCLGRRRYLAHVREATTDDVPLDLDLDLGEFPWRIEYDRGRKVLHTFDARVRGGVLKVPSYLDAAVARGEEPRL